MSANPVCKRNALFVPTKFVILGVSPSATATAPYKAVYPFYVENVTTLLGKRNYNCVIIYPNNTDEPYCMNIACRLTLSKQGYKSKSVVVNKLGTS